MLTYMLDTNICIFTVNNEPTSIREAFNLHYGQLCISAITLVELVYGAEKSSRPERNLAVVEGFTARHRDNCNASSVLSPSATR
ncbi:Ribonuclease VapC [Pseudomonas syringae pv. cilantro]|nr:Ribonuclease VapC [Pseudomonas syringae pv. cilantro]KPW73490.1 Ribonuclease VapC [Pseudomonas syringae pv. coriandricola]